MKEYEEDEEEKEDDDESLVVCWNCGGDGCSVCDYDGVYNPDEVEPNGVN